MRILPTSLRGVAIVELEPHRDERGGFLRTYCEQTFAAHGLNIHWPQCNHTLTRQIGTIRGLHFQAAPAPEIKLVRCTAGVIWDVAVDVRPESATYGCHEAFELSAGQPRALYLPAGIAHGFQCLADNCEVAYMMSAPYAPELARGIRWDDPTLAIPWPIASPTLSDRDQRLPPLSSR
jgi:dTDP-4-dehydrorhamnose 3,5-epimerase